VRFDLASGRADAVIEGFVSETADVGGIRLHYVTGGNGPTVLLVHGFPQDWYEWRTVLARLAETFSVVAVDLRGVGGSDAPADGYDAVTMANDLHRLVEQLGAATVHVVGHDIGGWVAYAYARLHTDTVATVMIIETLIPGIEPFSDPDIEVPLWHGEFHMIPGLPEALVADRQDIYFRHFFDIGTRGAGVFSDDDVQHFAEAYGDAAHLRAAFEMYRAIPDNVAWNAAQRASTDVPLLLVGGEHVFGPVVADVAANLRNNFGWTDVAVEVVAEGQHYLVEERPDDIAALIERHAGRAPDH
jgi:pimeloyl-ACP methyl ester carboxylesterase